jgi:hypothetical protein
LFAHDWGIVVKQIGRISDWFKSWQKPVLPELVKDLENASKAAGARFENALPHSYELLIGRKIVAFSNPAVGIIHKWKNRLSSIIQGKPVPILLYQNDVSGFLGPFAKSRKAQRASGSIKENAIIFWPSPNGKISPKQTRYVLKVAVGSKNHAREIRMLRMAADRTGLTPAIHSYDPRLKWLVLDFIGNAKKVSEAEQAALYLNHIAKRYFAEWGTKSRSVRKLLKNNSVSEASFLKHAEKLGVKNATELLDGQLTYSITHGGGICEECLLTDDGKAYLLDWEKAGLGPVGDDLLQVFTHEPSRTVAFYNTLIQNGELPARDQLSIALILRFMKNTDKRYPSLEKIKRDYQDAKLLEDF